MQLYAEDASLIWRINRGDDNCPETFAASFSEELVKGTKKNGGESGRSQSVLCFVMSLSEVCFLPPSSYLYFCIPAFQRNIRQSV